MYQERALRNLARNFADPKVGGVAGVTLYTLEKNSESSSHGENAYWNYDDFTSGFATAVANCMKAGHFQCNTELGKAVISQCMKDELVGYSNDSGELASFAKDFCSKCAPGSSTCVGKFASAADQPGYLPSMFNDDIIKTMDNCEKLIDASTVTTNDASACLNASLVCEYIAIGLAGPPEACNDN